MQIEVDATVLDLGKEADQFRQGSSKPVHTPDGHHVDLAPGDGGQQAVVAGPFLSAFGARDLIGNDFDHLPAQPVGHGGQVGDLIGDGLTTVGGRHPTVQGGPLAERD